MGRPPGVISRVEGTMNSKLLERIGIAVVTLILAAGTVYAVNSVSSPDPGASALASDAASTDPSTEPEPTEAEPTPEPSDTAEPEPTATEPDDEVESFDEDELDEDLDDEAAKDKAPKADKVERIVERLGDAGIQTSAATFSDLAARVGVGNAVRVLIFADAAGLSTGEILEMRDSGMGWGVIRRELDLAIKPGIGWIMGNGRGPGTD
jgi:hypothetical protein